MVDRPQRERETLNLPAIKHGGRYFTKYDPEVALDIVARLSEGELLSKITSPDATPLTITRSTFLRWVATVPELQTAYSAALQLSAHAFEEKAIDKAEKTAALPGSPQNVSAASLLVGQYRWSAARRNPTRYSDKGNTQIVVPVNINTTLDLGSLKQTSDVEVPDIYTIKIEDGEFNEIASVESSEDGFRLGSSGPKQTQQPDPTSTRDTKAMFRTLLRPDEPVVGVSRQPILQTGKSTGVKGPRKRVLTPRIKK